MMIHNAMDQAAKDDRSDNRRIIGTYAIVGSLNAIAGIAIYSGMYYLLNKYLNYLVILLMVYVISIIIGFLGNRYIVFRSKGDLINESKFYVFVFIISLVANFCVMRLMHQNLGINAYASQTVATIVSSAIGFLGNRFITFQAARA